MRPITRIILIVIISATVCQVLYFPISRGLAKYYWNTNKRLNEIMNGSTAYDILFIGSSRTYLNINPLMIDSVCHVNSYNAGALAAKMKEIKMYFDGYCVHHPPPKILVLNFDLGSFGRTDELFKATQYLPFLNNPVVYNTLYEYNKRAIIIKRLPFMGLADFDDASKVNAIKSLLGMKRTELFDGEFEYKGYMSLPPPPDSIPAKPVVVEKPKRKEITDTAVGYLQSIIDTCQIHHIKLVFTYAPDYNFTYQRATSNSQEIFDFITQFAKKNNINFIRYDSLSLCKDPKAFADGKHLCTEAARAFSIIEAEDLKAIMEHSK